MKEKKLQIFVDIVKNYFDQFGGEELIVDTPYLFENGHPKVHAFTGVIGISGVNRGVVYFTASQALLKRILDELGEDDQSEDNYVDLVGEVANTISGNARTEFGSEFHISVPLVFQGAPKNVVLPKKGHSFIIPITWYDEVAEIVICLQD